jgi:hypothetical protein
VHTLAARRDAITAQLGNLSGVIDALAVSDDPLPGHSPTDHDTPTTPATPSTPAQEI